jgi:Calcium-binding EGF domain
MMSIIFLLLVALLGATNAQVRPPPKVNICYPIGNNVYSTASVLSAELDKYPGYVKGKCDRICTTLCSTFPSREVNAAGQCICKGVPLKCGPNATPSNDKKSCKCLAGYKGDAVKGCVDVNECADAKSTICPANLACENTPGAFKCVTLVCGANSKAINGKCTCDLGFEGDATKGCTDINECADPKSTLCPANQVYKNTPGSYKCVGCGANATLIDGKCVCDHGFEDDATVGCTNIDECGTEQCDGFGWSRWWIWYGYECVDAIGGAHCMSCGFYTRKVNGRCVCVDGYKENADGVCTCVPGMIEGCGASCGDDPNAEYIWWAGGCECKRGFVRDAVSGRCVDSDECVTGDNRCKDHVGGGWWKLESKCINLEGTYKCAACGINARVMDNRCVCNDGFSGNPETGCH